MKTILMLSVALIPYLALADMVKISSEVYDAAGKTVLLLEIENLTDKAVCFDDWEVSKSSLVEEIGGDRFIIRDESGNDAKYKSLTADRDPDDGNLRLFILPPGGVASAKYDLSSLYDLGFNEYSLVFLKSVILCEAYNYGNPYLMSSHNLKYLYLNNKLGALGSGDKLWGRFGEVVMVKDVKVKRRRQSGK